MDKRKGFILIALYLLLLTSIEFGVPYWFQAKCLFPWGKDAHWHLENLRVVYEVVTGEGDASVGDIFSLRFFYPPLVYFLSLPFCLISGKVSYAAALIPYFGIWFMLNLGLYLLGREVGGRWAGILAPFIFLGYRQIVWIMGIYNLQAPLCAWLPFLLLLLFRTRGFLKTGRTLAFFALLAVSFLTYLWVLQFMFFPVLATWILLGRPYRRSFVNLVLGSVLSLALVSPYILGHGVGQWLMNHFPGLMMVGKSTVEWWSEYFVEGKLFYVSSFFREPLNWLLLVALFFLPLKDKRVLVLLAGLAGGFLILHLFKNMYAERMLPLYVISSILLACGIGRSARWVKGAMVFVVLLAACITLYDLDDSLWDRADRSYYDFAMLHELEKDCSANPNTAYVLRLLAADHIGISLWLMPEPLDCLNGAVDPLQNDLLVASDPERRLVVVGMAWWEELCPMIAMRSIASYNVLLPMLCENVDKLKLLYSDPYFAFYEVPGEVRLERAPEW